MPSPPPDQVPPRSARFPTTRWTQVFHASQAAHPHHARGWDWLAANYWYPLYAYARRSGLGPEDAADRTQDFFAWLIESDLPATATPARGRFCSLLLTAFKHRLGMEARRGRSLKRGGGRTPVPLDSLLAEERYRLEPADPASPDKLSERRWGLDLIQRALDRLESEVNARGKPALFHELKAALLERPPQTGAPLAPANPKADSVVGQVSRLAGENAGYAGLAARLGMTEGAVKAAAHRLRLRFRALVREEVAATLPTDGNLDDELHFLQAILAEANSPG